MRLSRYRLCGLIVPLVFAVVARGQQGELGEPPSSPTPEMVAEMKAQAPARLQGSTTPLSVDTRNREEVRTFHRTVYAASEGYSMGWTGGDVESCLAGATDPAFRELVALRINYYRAMAGVPGGIALDEENNAKDQEAALMMSANGTLSHNPPATWTCYSEDGAEAAGRSNLSLGNAGPDAVDAYMQDYGGGNSAVGHRRWLLYPQTEWMGTGDLPAATGHWSANALWVFDENYGGTRPPVRDGYVAWPPPGYVPYPVVCPRWSFAYPKADFATATVSVTSNGVPVAVTLETVATGYGENTLVWYPNGMSPSSPILWPRPASDTEFVVQVAGARVGGASTNFAYTVTVFDPEVPGADVVLPVISGPDEPVVGQANQYTFVAVPGASGYQWQQTGRRLFTNVEGAENGLVDFTTETSSGYDVVVSRPVASGTRALRLAHPKPPTAQRLTYQRRLVPQAGGVLRFQSRLGLATTTQVAMVEVLLDGGSSWQPIYEQSGTDDQGELSYRERTVSLADYMGRSLRFRFSYVPAGTYYSQTSEGVGWYLDDLTWENVIEQTDPVVSEVFAGTNFVFAPPAAGEYTLAVRAQLYGQFYGEWGPVRSVAAVTGTTPVLRWVGTPSVSGGQLQMEFEVANHQAGLTFELQRSTLLTGDWMADGAAQFAEVVSGQRYRATAPLGSASREFYRVAVP